MTLGWLMSVTPCHGHTHTEKADREYNRVQSAHGSIDVLACSNNFIKAEQFSPFIPL